MILFEIGGCILAAAFIFNLLTRKYVQQEKFYFIFGKKGSGKSTTLTKIAIGYLKKGYKVYTSFDVPGCYKYNPKDIGHYDFEPGSVVIIDEMSLLYSNRDFKNMDKAVVEWFQYLRHKHCIVYGASVAFDIDLKLRDQADHLYLMKKSFRVFSICRRIEKFPDLIQANEFSEARITDNLTYSFFLLPGALMIAFIPHWAKYFDSHVDFNPKESIDSRTTYIPPINPKKKGQGSTILAVGDKIKNKFRKKNASNS